MTPSKKKAVPQGSLSLSLSGSSQDEEKIFDAGALFALKLLRAQLNERRNEFRRLNGVTSDSSVHWCLHLLENAVSTVESRFETGLVQALMDRRHGR